jgi:HD domain-containing protein
VPATQLPATTGASTLECMSALRTTIAGIPIPDSTLASDATQFVQDVSTQLLFDHSRRVFLWASLQGEKLGLAYDPELLYVGAMFHDTTPEIPRYKQPEVRLVTLGVEYDVLGLHFDELSAHQRESVLAAHPRTGFKQGIVAAFSAGMRDKPETTFGTMNTDILEATVPGYVRPNFCEYIQNSRFET